MYTEDLQTRASSGVDREWICAGIDNPTARHRWLYVARNGSRDGEVISKDTGSRVSVGRAACPLGFSFFFKRSPIIVLSAAVMLLSMTTSSQAQPDTVGDLRAWYDVTNAPNHNASGDAIANAAVWPDKSPQGAHMGQGGGIPPAFAIEYQTAADSILSNNLPSFRFLNANQSSGDTHPVNGSGLAGGSLPAHTVMVVGDFSAAAGHILYLGHNAGTAGMFLDPGNGNGTFGMFTKNQPAGTGDALASAGEWTPAGTQVFTYTYSGGLLDSDTRIFLNGGELTLDPATTAAQPTYGGRDSWIRMGAHGSVFNTVSPDGDVGDVVLWNGALSDAERLSVEQFFIQKYAIEPITPITEVSWRSDQSGDWNLARNWIPSLVPDFDPGGRPNLVAILGDKITENRTVFTDNDVTIAGIQFVNSNRYVVGGSGSVTLDAATVAPTANIDVFLGNHEFQAPVQLATDTVATIAANQSLTFNNAVNLNGNTLTKLGDGDLAIRNTLVSGMGGTVNLQQGSISGNGNVGGDVNNSGGTISPGDSLQASSQVPEPDSLVLLVFGLVGLLYSCRLSGS